MSYKGSRGGPVDHLDKELQSRLIRDLAPGEENDIDDDDLQDDDEEADAADEEDEIKKADKKKDRQKKMKAGDEKERRRQQEKEEEEDDDDADDDAPTDEKQEEDRITKVWGGNAKVNKGARKDERSAKTSKVDDHSEEVMDENRRYHMTSAFRHDVIDGSDEAWDEDAHKKEYEWDGTEQNDGYEDNDNLIEDEGDLYE